MGTPTETETQETRVWGGRRGEWWVWGLIIGISIAVVILGLAVIWLFMEFPGLLSWNENEARHDSEAYKKSQERWRRDSVIIGKLEQDLLGEEAKRRGRRATLDMINLEAAEIPVDIKKELLGSSLFPDLHAKQTNKPSPRIDRQKPKVLVTAIDENEELQGETEV